MTEVTKITLFRLYYQRLVQKADPNSVSGRNALVRYVYLPVYTSRFKRRDTDETFNILKGPLDCNSNHVIYLFKCIKYFLI